MRTAEKTIGFDSNPQQIVVDDFDGDHHLDFAVANVGSDSIDLFLGHGNGTFAHQISSSTGFKSRPYSIAQADFNNDHYIDLAVANYGTNSTGILLGYGNGSFTDPIIYPLGSSPPWAITIGDINHDNQLDVAVSNSETNSIGIFLGSYNGTFGDVLIQTIDLNSRPRSLITNDLTNDNKLDLIVIDSNNDQVLVL